MLPPVVCTTCGMPIGDVAFLYARMAPPAVKGEGGFFRPADGGPGALEAADGGPADGGPADGGPEAGPGLTPRQVCELLGVPDYCCIMHLTTAMRFADYY